MNNKDKDKFKTIIDLGYLKDKRIIVKTSQNEISGDLVTSDVVGNIVVKDCIIKNNLTENSTTCELMFIRGPNIISIFPYSSFKEISNPFI